MTTAPPTCSSPRRRSATTSRQHLGNGVRVHERDEFERALGEPRRQDAWRSIRSGRSRRSSRRSTRPARRSIVEARPAILPKAIKNEVEIAGHKAAQARDGAALSRFLHWLSIEAPKGGVDELGAAAQAAGLPPGGRRPARSQLRHHFGRRPQRRDRPLPGQRGDQPADRDGLDLSGRFGRPISGRHHRRHPHGRDRHADGRDDATASPASSRAISRSPAPAFPKGRAARSSTASPGSFCGRPGSITPTAPATASAASSRSTKGRSASRRPAAARPAATSRSRPA